MEIFQSPSRPIIEENLKIKGGAKDADMHLPMMEMQIELLY